MSGKVLTTTDEINRTLQDKRRAEVLFDTDNKIKTDDFRKEKDLVNYVVNNIVNFCEEVCCDKYLTHVVGEKAYYINKRIKSGFFPKKMEIDLLISGERFNHIIEFKRPKYYRDGVKGIGQILNYGRYFKSIENKKLYLITTLFDVETARTIEYYNLPIKYLYMDKNKRIEYGGEC